MTEFSNRLLDLVTPVRDLRAAGMSVRGIAPATGASPTTVVKILHLLIEEPAETVTGLDGKKRPARRRDTTERDARIVTAYRDEGKTMRVIAREVGCSVGTVHRVLVLAP